MCLGDVREFVLADVVSSKRGGQIIEITDRRSREVEVQLPTIHVADSETVAHALRDEYERSGGADHLAIFEAHDVLAVEHVERFAQSWCTWIGGPNPGGSSFSITDTTPLALSRRVAGPLLAGLVVVLLLRALLPGG